VGVLDKMLRAGEGRLLKKLSGLADQVNVLEEDFIGLSDAELRAKTDEYKARCADGETLDDLLPEAFATVREGAKRTLGQRHFDVQVMGGACLHLGNIAEMKTGEGKTLVSTLPAYLNALGGEGVHIVTTNDYLAGVAADLMGRVHRFLGLTVGVIDPSMRPDQRGLAYQCDITYGTNNEFGFDYLRDNMAWSAEDLVQRGHHFAIVDEVDSILVDEARTPLIISGPADHDQKWYVEFARMAERMRRDRHYEVDEKKRTVAVSEEGVSFVEDHIGVENLYESINTPLVGYLNNSIRAKELYLRDKEYVVVDGEVLIVDEYTGRVLSGRRYSEGMHQAIEAKEGVEIKEENQTLATITLQNYFRLYTKLSGMTGTAMTEAAEFQQIYKLGVLPIPTNRDMIRDDLADVVYKTELAKWNAVVEDIFERSGEGQPILVGTTTVEKSELLSGLLQRRGVRHEVLNAKQHAREAMIVAQAGRKGAVTVATNMAGRGTDILLGGNPEAMAETDARTRGLEPATPEWDEAFATALSDAKLRCEDEKQVVLEAGGLYVLGTERHESRRIDNQLRGRAGRQGDPGLSRFYLSLGDDLMRLFNGAAVEGIMTRLRIPDEVPIESKMVSNSIRSAQSQMEQQNFEIRKNVLKYDEVMNRQREVVYAERRRVLHGEDLSGQVDGMIEDVVKGYVVTTTSEGYPEDWDLHALFDILRPIWPVTFHPEEYDEGRADLTTDILIEDLTGDAKAAYAKREEELTPDVLRQLERQVVLSVLDRKWREHLYEMDYLQEGIGLRAMGQRDPLVEYQREGYELFAQTMEIVKEETVGFLFNLQVQAEPDVEVVQDEAVVDQFSDALAALGASAQVPDSPAELSSYEPAPVVPIVQPEMVAPSAGTPVAALSEVVAPVPLAPVAPTLNPLLPGFGAAADKPLTFSGPAEGGGVERKADPSGQSIQRPGGQQQQGHRNRNKKKKRR
jgi:preprotein translocase subunit SecA